MRDLFKNSVFKPSVDTIRWWKAAGVRAVKTMAQSALAMLPAAAMIQQVDWITVISTAALAGVASILTSIVGVPEVKSKED